MNTLYQIAGLLGVGVILFVVFEPRAAMGLILRLLGRKPK